MESYQNGGGLLTEYWELLKTRYIKNAQDYNDPVWNDTPRIFYENKGCYEYNMRNFKDTENLITRIKPRHNYAKAAKRESIQANNLKAVLYLSVVADVVLTSNLWNEVGLHNGAKVTVVYFVYTDSEGSINGGGIEAVVVQLQHLAESTHIEPFLEKYERSVAILMK